MKLTDAMKLHTGDEVMIKSTGEFEYVVEVEKISPKESSNGVGFVNVMIDNGEWYGHKEIA